MTGIERLRKLSKGMHNHRVTVWQLTDDAYAERFGVTKHGPTIKNFLSDIADQIEREMKASSEVEKMKCDLDGVSMSAYDLLPAEDREAVAWVRDHGGLDHVKAEWRSRVPYDLYERRRQRLLGHIAECETALGRRNERIEELGHRISDLTTENAELRRRAMPEGCEWPRYEEGEPVHIGDVAEFVSDDSMTVMGVELTGGGFILHGRNGGIERPCQVGYKQGERVRRPAVLASDGEPLEVGQTVYHIADGCEYRVVELLEGGAMVEAHGKPTGRCRADYLTHQRPVLDADGVPIHDGDKVWIVENGHGPRLVKEMYGPSCVHLLGISAAYRADQLTHTKPEPPDSWERIETDTRKDAHEYCEDADLVAAYMGREAEVHAMASDLVRRCRALAERERSE